jgi:hypothetical protein
MADREAALRCLAVGDIFHAESPNGASLICLVTSITEPIIGARTVTTQRYLEFNRQTGIAELGNEPVRCTIDSTTPLPVEVHDVMLEIDRKFRLEHNPEPRKLNDAEKRALLYVDSHYSSNQL